MRFETVGESEVLDPDSVSAIENTQNFDSTVDAVVSGVDDWLFAGDAIAAFHHKSDADEQLMEVWRDEITRREVRLSSKGIRYFHVCVPTIVGYIFFSILILNGAIDLHTSCRLHVVCCVCLVVCFTLCQ